DPRSGSHPGRELNGQRTPAADAPLAVALVAGVGNDRAEALAAAAGCRGHDLAQDGPHGALDLAGAAADVAGARAGARAAAAAVAGGADHGGVHLDLFVHPEDCVLEIDPHIDQGVLAAAGARCRTAARSGAAEETLEDVLEGEAGTGEAAAEAVV